MPIPTLADYSPQSQPPAGADTAAQQHRPLFSVVTVVKNNAHQLAATIDSMIDQTCQDFEYIVIDGGSTDGTLAVIERYQEHIDCWISEPDRGIYDAMNKGIARAQGKIIATLNSGDLYLPQTLALVAQTYERAVSDKVVIAGSIAAMTKNGFCLTQRVHAGYGNWHIAWHHQALFVTRSIYQQVGLFDITYQIAGDYDFVLRTRQQAEWIFLPEILTQTAPAGVSGNYYAVTLESHRVRLANGYPLLAAYLVATVKLMRISLHLLLDKIQVWQIFERLRHRTATHRPKLPR